MKLLIIAYNYPSRISPTRGVFVRKIVEEFIKIGVEVKVIAPHVLGSFFFKSLFKFMFFRMNYSKYNEASFVLRPIVFSFGKTRIGSTYLSQYFFEKTVQRSYNKRLMYFAPDATYGHFVFPAGMTAVSFSKKLNVKSFIAVGEDTLNHLSESIFSSYLDKADGVISVSMKNKKKLLTLSSLESEKIIVAPNSVNADLFYPRDINKMRVKYGFNVNDFILVFVGYFEERKGVLRVMEALNELALNIKIIIIGEGPQKPDIKNSRILFCDRVDNHLLPEYLSCGNVFILPTKSEGSCNAIYEAMACGLPIISSKIPEIEEQVNSENALLVDPMDVFEIRNAILQLFKDPALAKSMSAESLKISNSFSILDRALYIKSFIQQILDK
jgi:teichuronic acid biosynthesis glycosyltransferase TuaC